MSRSVLECADMSALLRRRHVAALHTRSVSVLVMAYSSLRKTIFRRCGALAAFLSPTRRGRRVYESRSRTNEGSTIISIATKRRRRDARDCQFRLSNKESRDESNEDFCNLDRSFV